MRHVALDILKAVDHMTAMKIINEHLGNHPWHEDRHIHGENFSDQDVADYQKAIDDFVNEIARLREHTRRTMPEIWPIQVAYLTELVDTETMDEEDITGVRAIEYLKSTVQTNIGNWYKGYGRRQEIANYAAAHRQPPIDTNQYSLEYSGDQMYRSLCQYQGYRVDDYTNMFAFLRHIAIMWKAIAARPQESVPTSMPMPANHQLVRSTNGGQTCVVYHLAFPSSPAL